MSTYLYSIALGAFDAHSSIDPSIKKTKGFGQVLKENEGISAPPYREGGHLPNWARRAREVQILMGMVSEMMVRAP